MTSENKELLIAILESQLAVKRVRYNQLQFWNHSEKESNCLSDEITEIDKQLTELKKS